MKRAKKTTLMKKADDLWRECIYLLWDYRCAHCATTTNRMNAHHHITRSNRANRYRLDNGICLCVTCHTFSGTLSAHETPLAYLDWLGAKYPARLARIRRRSNETLPPPGTTHAWYYEQIERLTAVLARLKERAA